jgi:ribosomal protein S18 acetylase RimI-like enzyme
MCVVRPWFGRNTVQVGSLLPLRVLSAMQIRPYQPNDQAAVIALWEQCGLVRPWNAPKKDIERKLSIQPELFLIAEVDNQLVATVMAGYEGHRGWLNYFAVAPDHQRKGIGRSLLAEAEQLLCAAGCPKINLQVRASNKNAVDFYLSCGYSEDEVISLGKRLESDQKLPPKRTT